MKKRIIVFCVASLLFLFLWIQSAAQEEINFTSAGTTLSGTLILPDGTGPFPLVVFVHGSGAEKKSNSRSRAKDFAKNGIASFIYDKRGVDKSGGDRNFPQYYSFDTLAMDVNAAIDELSKRKDINTKKIGLVASSQGGWVAPLAASLNKSISFLIIASGSVSTVGEDNLFERNVRLRSENFTESEVKEAEAMHVVDQEVSRSGTRFDEFSKMWEQYKSSNWFKRVYLSDQPSPPGSIYRSWYKRVVDFEPMKYLHQLSIPILWLYGDSTIDRFCPVDLSIKRLSELKAAGKKYEIISFPGADHSLQKKSKDLLTETQTFEWLRASGVLSK